MVHLVTELERIFPIKCNALLTHNSALRRNGMRQSELNVNLHKKGRLWSTSRPESGVNNDMISRKMSSQFPNSKACLSFSYLSITLKMNRWNYFPDFDNILRFSSDNKIPFSKKQFSNTELWLIFNVDKITLIAQKYKKSNFFATMKMFLTLTFRL